MGIKLGHKVDRIWAFIATDSEGTEGIMAFLDPIFRTWMPMFGSDSDHEKMEEFEVIAENIKKRTGIGYRIVSYYKVEGNYGKRQNT